MRLSPILSFVNALAATAPAHEEPGPPSSEVQISGIAFGGSGCSAASVSVRPSSSLPTLEFDAFNAYSGPNITALSYRRNCQIRVNFKYPAGWQFSISTADYRGYALVPAGMTGLTKATYYFSGERAQVSYNETIKGPYDGRYLRADRIDVASAVWSPCGTEGLLYINSETRLSPVTNSTGELTLERLQNIGLAWRRCSPAPPLPAPESSSTATP